MSERIWDKFLTDQDKAVLSKTGFGAKAGLGKRPALLVIDVSYAFCDVRPTPILESIEQWQASCGESAWLAIPHIKSLITACHAKAIPVIYTTGQWRKDNWDAGSWLWKLARFEEQTYEPSQQAVDGNQIVSELEPLPQDIVIHKQKPSAFFGTNLQSYLTLLGCDSLVVTGTSTSGCVRATVLDAFSLNYRVTVAEDGCFDRLESSHALNLMDMNGKYSDVLKTSEVLNLLEDIESGAFTLPRGDTTR